MSFPSRARFGGPFRAAGVALAAFVVLLGCGPAPTGPQEPVPPPPVPSADAGAAVDAAEPAAEAVPEEVGPLPGPPGADPPGFAVYDPLPEGVELSRALWKIEGPSTADALREGVGRALGEIATCLAGASPGGRLPMHLVIEASGRVVEVGAPLADAALREAITCAQSALRMLRFPESPDGETTVRLIVER
jgi:hypothetical protein